MTFYSVDVVFRCIKILMKSNFFRYFAFWCHIRDIAKSSVMKHLLCFLMSFIVLGHTFRSLIHSKLILGYGVR